MKGNPQLRVFMPLFWMKMLKSKHTLRPCEHLFEVHPQMTKYDVKNYLEKIYDVPVVDVTTKLVEGEEMSGLLGDTVRDADKRLAFVTVDKSADFEFPNLFKERKTEQEEAIQEYQKMAKKAATEKRQNWMSADTPSWFK